MFQRKRECILWPTRLIFLSILRVAPMSVTIATPTGSGNSLKMNEWTKTTEMYASSCVTDKLFSITIFVTLLFESQNVTETQFFLGEDSPQNIIYFLEVKVGKCVWALGDPQCGMCSSICLSSCLIYIYGSLLRNFFPGKPSKQLSILMSTLSLPWKQREIGS